MGCMSSKAAGGIDGNGPVSPASNFTTPKVLYGTRTKYKILLEKLGPSRQSNLSLLIPKLSFPTYFKNNLVV
eukprot:scaffold388412_cov41-Prasinocladus_malaysianus.AAC.1